MSNRRKSVKIGSDRTVATNKSQTVELPLQSQQPDKYNDSKKRKLHKTYIKGWSEDIANCGFARCIIATCNFVSSDLYKLQEHHKGCNGVPFSGKNICENCGGFVPKNKDYIHHKTICKAAHKAGLMPLYMCMAKTEKSCTNRIEKNTNKAKAGSPGFFCSSRGCSFVATKLADMEVHSKYCSPVPNASLFCCLHCRAGFDTKEEHVKHQQNCKVSVPVKTNSKRAENLHFRVIKQMKNKDSSDEHIIQPGPDLPEGQYRRRRAYRAEHRNSWALTLEKFKYVKCIYQNCYFIAMSLEDMIAHFGYCNGDGSFAKFVCPYCNGRVTSEAILVKHIERSHPSESASVKVQPVIDKNGDDYSNSNAKTEIVSEENLEEKESEKSQKMSKAEEATRKTIWEGQIKEVGVGFCGKSLCNFMAPTTQELEAHLETCDGTANFELFNCEKCRHRLPTKEHLARHVSICTYGNDFSAFESVITNPRRFVDGDLEIGPVVRQYKSKRPNAKQSSEPPQVNAPNESPEADVVAENENSENENRTSASSKQKTRRKPKKTKGEEEKEEDADGKKTCAKCDYRCAKETFVYHNLKKHFGLAWMEGEEPIDLNDDKLLIRLVKEAFKYTKKAACEKCDVVKRSVMGFVSHVQICGKSEEERNALKVQCPHCEGKYVKYSLATHIKLSHSGPEEVEEVEEAEEKTAETSDSSRKRRSAIKAVSKFQEVLNDNDEVETSREIHYILYEKGSERMPKLNSKLNNLWYKLKRENKKIPCRHANCSNLSNDVKEAKNHHYTCPLLPEKVFLCELCDFYSVTEEVVKSHLTTHRKYVKMRKISEEEAKPEEANEEEENEEEEEEEVDEEEEEEARSSEEEPNEDEPRKRKKKKSNDPKIRKKLKFSTDGKADFDIEFRLRHDFCRREKIDNIRGVQFFSNGMELTLEEDILTSESLETWPELHTQLEDWSHVPVKQAGDFLPKLTKSVSVRFVGNETNWKRFDRFDGDLIGGIPVMFTGGSVRSMSWSKVSCRRMVEKTQTQREYLAVATASELDYLKDIHDKSSVGKCTLLQIWDCGPLENDVAGNAPKFALGIVQKGGQIWNLAWFPQDTYVEGTKGRLRRLGLLATACEDGAVRVWSICDPSQLHNSTDGLPLYKTEPVVMLVVDKDIEESCLQLSVGLDGAIAGGYSNGVIAVWNLKNLSSPFCKKLEKCRIMRAHLVFQAHKTAITALTFCPSSSRYISTAGLDRFVKVWDLEFPSVPIEQSNKEYSLDNIWTLNWPSLIYNFDDVVINFNKGAVKFIRDILTDRHQSTFAMEDTCLSLAFSDWLNALCGGSITGEVKLRLLKNLIHDQKRSQSTISSVRLEKLNDCDETENSGNDKGKTFPRSYDEVVSRFGLVFKENLGVDKKRPEKPEAHPEEFPIRAVNKIAFNPNFKSFTHIALGYNCGLIKIQPLKELQSTRSLKFFLEKAHRKTFNSAVTDPGLERMNRETERSEEREERESGKKRGKLFFKMMA